MSRFIRLSGSANHFPVMKRQRARPSGKAKPTQNPPTWTPAAAPSVELASSAWAKSIVPTTKSGSLLPAMMKRLPLFWTK